MLDNLPLQDERGQINTGIVSKAMLGETSEKDKVDHIRAFQCT